MKLVYECDYCNHTQLDINEITIHEQKCLYNPVNKEKLPLSKSKYNWEDHEIEFFKNNFNRTEYVDMDYPEVGHYIPRYIPRLYFLHKNGSVLRVWKDLNFTLGEDITEIFKKAIIQNKINDAPDYDD